MSLETVRAAGIDCLNAMTALLQRVRLADAIAGIWEAADVQWWWRRPRSSDSLEQTFWVDDDGPVGAVLFTEWGDIWQLDLILVPDRVSTLLRSAWEEALAHVSQFGLPRVQVLARDDDQVMLQLLAEAGFTAVDESAGATWMAADERPESTALPGGYRFTDRTRGSQKHHWLDLRNGPDVEARLAQGSLYDPELDMAVETLDGQIAAYALFWFDPVTSVGMIEPMRTDDAHQRRGLARALIGQGLERLAARGAKRLKVGYSTEAARALYVHAGFEPTDSHHAYRQRF